MKTYCFWIVGLLLVVVRLQAQTDAVAAFDSGYVETGNPFMLHLSVPERYGQPESVDFSAWDTLIPAGNILRQSDWQLREGRWTRDVELIVFDSAEFSLPPLQLVFPGGDTLGTNRLTLKVLPTPSPDDPADMLDIRDIYREPSSWRDYLPPLLPVAAGVLVLALVIWWLLYRRRKTGLESVRTIRQPAHELALRKLTELERRQLWQQGDIKLYYSELTYIAREYLERRYNIPTLESPSDEIMRLLVRTDIPASMLTSMAELLRWADLAKFAKGTPPSWLHEQALQQIRQMIEHTKPRPTTDHQPQNDRSRTVHNA